MIKVYPVDAAASATLRKAREELDQAKRIFGKIADETRISLAGENLGEFDREYRFLVVKEKDSDPSSPSPENGRS